MALLGIVLVLFLTYYCTKLLSKRISKYSSSKNIRIIDQVPLGQNKFLMIVDVCNKHYLMSVTDNNISILKDIDDIVEIDDIKLGQTANASFGTFLNEAFSNMKLSSKIKKGNMSDEFGKKTKK